MNFITLLTAGALFLAPAGAMPPDADAEKQREWLSVQTGKDREARASWWRDLDPMRLDAYIRAGADITRPDRRGWTPLHSAARYSKDPRILSALLDAGADIGARNSAGDTPLHWAAAENANVDIVRTLIEAGADVNARDRYGWLPIHTAADRNPNPEIIDALVQAGSTVDKRAYFVLFRPRFLLKHNSNMSGADKKAALALLEKPE